MIVFVLRVFLTMLLYCPCLCGHSFLSYSVVFLSGSESVQAFWVAVNLCRLFEWKWICAGFLSGSESVQAFWVEVNLCKLFEWKWICAGFLSGSESVQVFWVAVNLFRLFGCKWICAGFLSGSESVQAFLIVYICIGINDQIIKTERVVFHRLG
jgi:hypothetical protein